MGKPVYFCYKHFVSKIIIIGFWLATPLFKKLKDRKEEEKKCYTDFKKKYKKRRGQKRILFHCSSLGEWEQAAPLIEIIKKQKPQIDILVSFFSISGYKHVKDNPYISGKLFLPFDSFSKAFRFFEILQPDLWIISAYDIWPNHVMAAKKLKIPIAVISATLASTSGRNKGISKELNKYVYKNIQTIYSRSANDTKRFLEIYPFPEKLKTFGDTRADRVYEKSINIMKEGDVPVFSSKGEKEIVFIAGSSWPADEKAIIPGTIAMLKKHDNLKAIVVPHEINDEHLASIEKQFLKNDLHTERYSSFLNKGGTGKRVAIIDAVGILAKLYKNTHIAYIGGSFGKGVHNVLEPAVFGMPVLFGPRHHNSQEAIHLTEMGAAFSIKNKNDFITIMEKLLEDDHFRKDCSIKAKKYIKNNLGASGKICQHLLGGFDFIQ